MDCCYLCCFKCYGHGDTDETTETDSSCAGEFDAHQELNGLQAETGELGTKLVCLQELIEKLGYFVMIPLLANSKNNIHENRLGNLERSKSGTQVQVDVAIETREKGGSTRDPVGLKSRSQNGKLNQKRELSQKKVGKARYETIPEEEIELIDKSEFVSASVWATNSMVTYANTQSDRTSGVQLKIPYTDDCLESDRETFV